MVLTETGLAKVFQRIKSFVASQLNSKASAIHTHTKSEITDFPTNYVTTDTTQTIGGNKTFSDGFSVNKPSPRLQMKSTTYSSETSSGMTIGDIAFLGNNGRFSAWIVNQLRDDLTTRLCFRAFPQDASTYKGFAFDDSCNLYPENANSALGTSTSKWKLLNGINPGALSLPSISSTGTNAWIAIDTTNWVASLATSNAQKYMPPADGWLNVRVDNAVALGLALTDGGNYMHQMVRSETPSSLALLLPVFKNKEVAILVGGNENFAYTRVTFYPCQGNV